MFRKKKQLEVNGHAITPGADLTGADLSGLFSASEFGVSSDFSDFFVGVNLTSANLTGVNFRHLSLETSLLIGANLTKAQLGGYSSPGANFSKACLEEAELDSEFNGCNFAGAAFRKSILEDCYFTSCNFGDAVFDNANLRNGVHFTECNLSGVRFTNTNLSDDIFFEGCDLSRASFVGLRTKAWFTDCDLRNADFSTAKGDFFPSNCQLDGANFGTGGLNRSAGPNGAKKKTQSGPKAGGLEAQLAELESLLEQGLIEDDEYEALRKKTLGL